MGFLEFKRSSRIRCCESTRVERAKRRAIRVHSADEAEITGGEMGRGTVLTEHDDHYRQQCVIWDKDLSTHFEALLLVLQISLRR